MSLALNSTFLRLTSDFQSTTDDPVFQQAFIDAVNDTLDELSAVGALETPHTHVTAYNGTVSTLDDDYQGILRAGVAYNLAFGGQRHRQGDAALAMLAGRWELQKAYYCALLGRDDQADEDDEGVPSNDVIGLGYLGG